MIGARVPPFLLEKRDNSIMGAVARKAEGRRPLNTRKAIRLCKAIVVICDSVYTGGTWGEIRISKPRYGFADLDATAYMRIPVFGNEKDNTHLVSINVSSTKYRGITMDAMAGRYTRYPEVKFEDMQAFHAHAERAGRDLSLWVDGIMAEMGHTRITNDNAGGLILPPTPTP